MSLVSYAYSDSDEDNQETTFDENRIDINTPKHKTFLKLPEPKCKEEVKIFNVDIKGIDNISTSNNKKAKEYNNVFDKRVGNSLTPSLVLPKPKSDGKVQITIPSLSDFNDDDDDETYQPKRKIIKQSNNGCGLFSMLPNPKNQKTVKATSIISMVPRSAVHKIDAVVKTQQTVSEIKLFENKSTELEDEVENNEEDLDFLGLNKLNDIPNVAPIDGFEVPEIKNDTSIIENDDKVFGPVYCPNDAQSDIYEDNETKLTLDSNALKQLGDRDKNLIKQVEVINVNMSQVLEESQQWLQKNMTEEYAESRNVNSDINVTGQSKRKHQITYLAQQAKANELKLKNMWAENRLTRKQTQAKYGF
ncbi:uncharacterized protein LOC126894194 [Daktulosphaira vitifoliae]|uniref:uncharacterized protein LOC126894194 n=1 Tax=Daktulosphaira vitifoliae TaxID=58002 RepID=UPI0021A9D75B|nr:uncharacterized protein LOC126894194 [Daktulosphaira vitifoliae]